MLGHRFEIELNGRKDVAWEDTDGLIGVIEVYLDPPAGSIHDTVVEIWQRGHPVTKEIRRIVVAMDVTHLLPRRRRRGNEQN